MAMTESMGYAKRHEGSYLRYSTVTGYFLQDEEDTDAQKFDYVGVRVTNLIVWCLIMFRRYLRISA